MYKRKVEKWRLHCSFLSSSPFTNHKISICTTFIPFEIVTTTSTQPDETGSLFFRRYQGELKTWTLETIHYLILFLCFYFLTEGYCEDNVNLTRRVFTSRPPNIQRVQVVPQGTLSAGIKSSNSGLSDLSLGSAVDSMNGYADMNLTSRMSWLQPNPAGDLFAAKFGCHKGLI